jgi:hypothetical protein
MVAQDPKWSSVIPDFVALATDVFSRLDREPVRITVSTPAGGVPVAIGKADVQLLISLLSGETQFLRSLPALFYGMSSGAYSPVAPLILALKTQDVGTAMAFTMHCASGVSSDRLARIEQETAAILGNAINFPFSYPDVCEALGVRDLGEDFRAPVVADTPALFLSGVLDGRVSIPDAVAVRSGFANSYHVIIEGAAHDFNLASAGVQDLIFDFLDGRPPNMDRVRLPFQFQ